MRQPSGIPRMSLEARRLGREDGFASSGEMKVYKLELLEPHTAESESKG
jgi:hypothetical protein